MTEKRMECTELQKEKIIEMTKENGVSYRKRAEQLLYAQKGLRIRMETLEEELLYLRALRDHAIEKKPETAYIHTAAELEKRRALKAPEKNASGGKAGELLFFPMGTKQMERRLYDIQCDIAYNRLIVRRIDRAVETLKDDPYYNILYLKYTEGLPEEEIAYQIHCDTSTVRRNKNRLLERLAVIFYGAPALASAV